MTAEAAGAAASSGPRGTGVAAPGTPAVSVIVPAYAAADALPALLDTLDAQDLPRDRFEVLLVDNGDDERVRALVEARAGVRYLREERPGSYAARNRGLAEARGDVIAFTDADCRPRPNWIRRGLAATEALAGPGLVAGRIRIVCADPERPTAVEIYESVASFRQEEYVRRWHFGATANVFAPRSLFDAVGVFDAEFRSLGDVEWGRRVHAAGFPLVYRGDVVVEHPARRTLGEFRRRAARVTGGYRRLARGAGFTLRDRMAYAACGLVPLDRLVAVGPDAPIRGVRRRAAVLAVATVVVAVRCLESARLALGGEPARR